MLKVKNTAMFFIIGLIGRIAIVKPWPEIKTAEGECITYMKFQKVIARLQLSLFLVLNNICASQLY